MKYERFETMEATDYSQDCPYWFHLSVSLKTKAEREKLKKEIRRLLQS